MKITPIVILLFFLFSCQYKQIKTKKRGIYLWKVQQEISSIDTTFFVNNKIENFYIRFFDVGLDKYQEPFPKAPLNFKGGLPFKSKIIPVIYIENKVLKNIKKNEVVLLSKNIWNKVESINQDFFKNNKIQEIQIDCDWTESTKNNLFLLLQYIKKEKPETQLSATIRLYQIKYQNKAGVPPVDKGVLMYYNMGNFKNEKEKNSILNNQIGQQYISNNTKYPLPLDLALPIYSWTLWSRNNEFKEILYKINASNINEITFLSKEKNNRYKINKDTVFQEKYFRYGDVLKLENPILEEILKAKEVCKPIINKNNLEIIIFSYSPNNSIYINEKDFSSIYN